METTTTEIDWESLIDAVDPERKTEPEVAYEFSNGRRFYRKEDPYEN